MIIVDIIDAIGSLLIAAFLCLVVIVFIMMIVYQVRHRKRN